MPKSEDQAARIASAGLNASTTIATLAKSPLLEILDGHELVVYLKLVAAIAAQRTRRVGLRNHELLSTPRTAARALQRLEERGLVRLHYPEGMHVRREIEVL